MQKSPKESWETKFFAVLIGAFAAMGAAAVFYPVVMIVFDKFFEWDPDAPEKGITINSLIFAGTFLIWSFIAAFAGGFVSAIISIKKEYKKVWILIVVGLIVLKILNPAAPNSRDYFKIALSITFLIAGALTGCALGKKYKEKKEKRKNATSDTPPFPADIP